MLRAMAAAAFLIGPAPVLAQSGAADLAPPARPAESAPAKGKSKTKKVDGKAATPELAPAPASAAVLAPPAPAAAPAPSAATKVGDGTLTLELAPAPKKGAAVNELPLGDIPSFEDIDATVLKDVALCIFPFIKEDKVADASGAQAPGQNLERIQKIFSDVARSSPLLRNTITLGKDAPICGIEDVTCIAALGNFTGCQAVLAGRATREDNGFTLRARMIDAKKGKLVAKVNQVVATDDEAEMAAWAEGQACRALKVNCVADEKLDADRADIRIFIDNKPITRQPGIAPGAPEQLSLSPGVYKVRATIGQRSSREIVLAVRRNQPDVIYVRQTADGGIPIILKSDLRPGDVPPPSVEVRAGTKPTKVVGLISAGLGIIAEGIAMQQFAHSNALANEAANNYTANGYYQQADLNRVSSARSAHTTSVVLTGVGAGLIVLGGVLYFAF